MYDNKHARMFPFNKVFIPDAVITSTCLNLPFPMQQAQFTLIAALIRF